MLAAAALLSREMSSQNRAVSVTARHNTHLTLLVYRMYFFDVQNACMHIDIARDCMNTITIRVPSPPGKSWIFYLENSRTWKVLEKHFGLGKSWKLKFKVLESPGKIS